MSRSVAASHAVSTQWWDLFWERLQNPTQAALLKEAAICGDLRAWTTHLTALVVKSCQDMKWIAAAKGFPLDLLPQIGQEYLGIDVSAFITNASSAPGQQSWRFPIAAYELENSRKDDRVAYSLWKVLCLRAALRVVFAYRSDWEEARNLVALLTRDIIDLMSIQERTTIPGETIVVIGSKGEGSTFPWGYFKMWKLDPNTARFEKA